MSCLDRVDINSRLLYSDRFYSGDYSHKIYLARANDDGSGKPKFYIWAMSNIDGKEIKQGYLYFYLDFENKTSSFIGVKVFDEFRNLNIGSMLVSIWIDICLNNGYDFLGVNKKQRKPFLLYLLKTYGFEILDMSLYQSSRDVISICRREDDFNKLLLFKDNKHEEVFRRTKIFNTDNYEIIDSLNGVSHLDDIIMPLQDLRRKHVDYTLLDFDKANVKVKSVINNHRK